MQAVRLLGVAALIASAVMTGMDIANDFHGDASDLQKAMDVLQLTSTGILLLGEIASAAAAETAATVLGPVGLIIGVVAIIISFTM